ncbi:hypothetical protein [Flagellimonas flava]|uniref:Uncharacterized protein n=1 Tax=Flagellimonas flava TaxID=570519 RepID=A0A1M5HMW3_9FLAO|nr:hypothetical protein [Allomuricauda flava]SHG17306.1 hypothetical protein SAMN04488116_0080 [Allomuricauda flava]
MKTRKIILLIVFILGVISLLILSSFISRNACEYANSNLEYIKIKTEEAITAENFEQSKYFSFKALNSIEKTRSNFIDCGCDGTIESLEAALFYLKESTKATSFRTSKKELHKALEHIAIGTKVLDIFEEEAVSAYGNDILFLNTKDALKHQGGIVLNEENTVKKQVHTCLLGFESSLDKVVTGVECKEAHQFISRIHNEAIETLLDTGLSEHKKQYHQRVKTITMGALKRLGDCGAGSLLAGK